MSDQQQEEHSIRQAPFRPQYADALVASVLASLDGDKAEDILTIDLRGRSDVADKMVVATGRSQRQVGAMADHLVEKLKGAGIAPSVVGMGQGDWVLIDAGDLIVHLFRPEVRAFYDLEGIWLDPAEDGAQETQRA